MKTRKQTRQPVSASGMCSHLRSAPWPVRLDDLTVDGCRIADPHGRLAKGQRIEIRVEDSGAFRAEVCWHRKGEAGIAFAKALPDAMLAQLRESEAAPSPTAQPNGARFC